ncbi:AraC family transcriptional regulator [Burkholderia sp. WSM2232]|uniref:AraC family transcriptional regulator n=1 Tax=Burkholderia sp. WSM2232 TaxID=944436 RepID=UPI00041FC760|nr:AraC family transcriptional regulator [Burkholderia sp. WSM2232]
MDLLGEALSSLKCDGHVLGMFRLYGDWGFDIEGVLPGYYYVVLDGECWVSPDGREGTRLGAGDSVLAPRGGPLKLAAHARVARTPMRDVWSSHNMPAYRRGTPPAAPLRLNYVAPGGIASAEPAARLLAVAFSFGEPEQRLLSALPDQIVTRAADEAIAPWLQPAIEFVATEESSKRAGFSGLSGRLIELILVSLIRAYALSNALLPAGWLCALRDARVGRALEAMHLDPSAQWPVAKMAQRAAMSRSAFAARFAELVGETPNEYLTALRMHVARRLIDESDLQIQQIATRVGYRSERAFRSAFNRHVGVCPSQRRRRLTPRGPR